jgi:hypothetical protein
MLFEDSLTAVTISGPGAKAPERATTNDVRVISARLLKQRLLQAHGLIFLLF